MASLIGSSRYFHPYLILPLINLLYFLLPRPRPDMNDDFHNQSFSELSIYRIYFLTGSVTVSSFIFLAWQYGVLNQSASFLLPLLELQLQQQIATVDGLFHGGRKFKCSIVAQSPRGPSVLWFIIALWQYTQVLSRTLIFLSSSSEIPYLLDMTYESIPSASVSANT